MRRWNQIGLRSSRIQMIRNNGQELYPFVAIDATGRRPDQPHTQAASDRTKADDSHALNEPITETQD